MFDYPKENIGDTVRFLNDKIPGIGFVVDEFMDSTYVMYVVVQTNTNRKGRIVRMISEDSIVTKMVLTEKNVFGN